MVGISDYGSSGNIVKAVDNAKEQIRRTYGCDLITFIGKITDQFYRF